MTFVATILYSICLSAYRPMSMVPTRNPNLMVVATAAHSSFEAVGKTSGPNYQIVTMANQFSIRISRDPPMSRHIAPPLAVPARATAGFAPVHLGRSQVSDSWRLSLCLLRPCGLYRFYLSSTRNIIGTDRKFQHINFIYGHWLYIVFSFLLDQLRVVWNTLQTVGVQQRDFPTFRHIHPFARARLEGSTFSRALEQKTEKIVQPSQVWDHHP